MNNLRQNSIFKRIFSLFTLVCYLFMFVGQSYAQGSTVSKQAPVQHAVTQPIGTKLAANAMRAGMRSLSHAAANATDTTFMSQANASQMPVAASVNPQSLQVNLNLPVVKLAASAVSPLAFTLSLTNYPGIENSASAVFIGSHYAWNIPAIAYVNPNLDPNKKPKPTPANTDYYFLQMNQNRYPLTLNHKDGSFHIYYQKKRPFDFKVVDDKTIKITAANGTVYLFTRTGDRYDYLCDEIIGIDGSYLKFGYNFSGSGEAITVRNKSGVVLATLQSSHGSALVSYRDPYNGKTPHRFTVSASGNDTIVTNALGEATQIDNNADGSINQLRFANGASESFGYNVIPDVKYILDGLTTSVKVDARYVTQSHISFRNKYNQDVDMRYKIGSDSGSHNFIGNGISCKQSIFEHVNILQDWMMECALAQSDTGSIGYTYTNTTTMPVALFSGKQAPLLQVTKSSASTYNALQLPISSEEKIALPAAAKNLVGASQNISATHYDYIYNTNITHFSDLPYGYDKPTTVTKDMYAQGDDTKAPEAMTTQTEYYKNSQGGGYLGQVKASIDPYGVVTMFKYAPYPADKSFYAPLVATKRVIVTTADGKQHTTTQASQGLAWYQKTVSDVYSVSHPYWQSNDMSYDGHQLDSHQQNVATDGLLAGSLYTSQIGFNADAKSVSQLVNAKADTHTGVVTISGSSKDITANNQLADTSSAPKNIQGLVKTYNKYGVLIKIQDQVTGNVTLYDNYDALGRITQMRYQPGGHSDHERVYTFNYTLEHAPNTGYEISETVKTQDNPKGYKKEVFYNQMQKPVKTYVEGLDRAMFEKQVVYYNNQGSVAKQVDYNYDQDGRQHLLTTSYQYDVYGKKAAIEHSDGSTDVIVNEPYQHRTMTYTLRPTTTVITGNSLCHDTTHLKDGKPQAVSCQVGQVQVKQQELSQDTSTHYWSHLADNDYTIGLDEHLTDTDATGAHARYTAAIQAHISQIKTTLSQGEALDKKPLDALADGIRQSCVQTGSETVPSCVANAFTRISYNKLGQTLQRDNLVVGQRTTMFYSPNNPNQVQASTLFTQNKAGSWSPIRTFSYRYDHYQQADSLEVAPGDNKPQGLQSGAISVSHSTTTVLGYTTSATSGLGHSDEAIKTTYDPNTGLPLSLTNAQGQVHTITYDTVFTKQPKTVTWKDSKGQVGHVLTYAYDSEGNVVKAQNTDAQGKVLDTVTKTYNAITNQLLTTEDNTETSDIKTTYRYNKYGVLTGMNYQVGSHAVEESFIYTPEGLPKTLTLKESGRVLESLTQTYNPDMTVASVKQGGLIKTNTYDSQGRLQKVVNEAGNTITYAYAYNRAGQRSMQTTEISSLGQAAETTTEYFGYSPLLQLTQYQCNGSHCPVDADGVSVSNTTYSYGDMFNQLQSVATTGTIAGKAVTDTTTYHYDAKHPTQVIKIIDTGNAGEQDLSYDANGNVAQIVQTLSDGKTKHTTTMGYNAGQQLVDWQRDKLRVHYAYNAAGQRTSETVSDSNGNPARLEFGYLADKLASETLNGKTRYYLAGGTLYQGQYAPFISDGFNITGRATDNQAMIVQGYTPFGYQGTKADTAALTLAKPHLGYRGHYTDQVTGSQLLGNGYRDYSPELRLFAQHDSASPTGRGGLNAYSYVLNNPINGDDHTGHSTDRDLALANEGIKADEKLQQREAGVHLVQFFAATLGIVAMGAAGLQLSAGLAMIFSAATNTAIAVVTTVASSEIMTGKANWGAAQKVGFITAAATFASLALGLGLIRVGRYVSGFCFPEPEANYAGLEYLPRALSTIEEESNGWETSSSHEEESMESKYEPDIIWV